MKNILWLWRLLRKPDFFPLLLVIFFGLLASKGLMGVGYFNMHDDLQMMRQLQMEKCFLDGQIPCRWVPDMGYGFGYPLFNFYPPLPYLVGEIVRVLGYSFVDTVKILFVFSLVASGAAMYFLAKDFFGRFGGVVASVFYIWAPYHAVDVYVRGAMNEAWALIWFPLIFWTSYKLVTSDKRKVTSWIVGLTLSWFGLFTSHNLMVIIFAPFFALWCLLWIIKSGNISRISYLLVSGLWSFGLAAFFTLPVLLEKNLVQTDTLVVGYYEYTAHFPNISQLLSSRFWGYGPSVWQELNDGMSFQIGWFHWGLTLPIAALLVLRLLKNKKINYQLLTTSYMLIIGWFAAFMAHSRSTPIWQAIEPLRFVQFPWRFLTIVILVFSFAAGSLTLLLPKILKRLIPIILIPIILIYSWNYFLPEHGHLGPLTDQEKFSGAAWELQQTAGIYDYLPVTAKTAPKEPRRTLLDFIEGSGKVASHAEGTNWAKLEVITEGDSLVRLNILSFPKWRVFVDDLEVSHFIAEDEGWGRMYLAIPGGTHEIYARLFNTLPRTVGNSLSLVSWAVLIVFVIKFRVWRSHTRKAS